MTLLQVVQSILGEDLADSGHLFHKRNAARLHELVQAKQPDPDAIRAALAIQPPKPGDEDYDG